MKSFNIAIFLKKGTKVFFLMLLFLGVFCFSGAARSQQDPTMATTVQVSPVRFEWDMNSGEERAGVVNLKNYSKDSYDIEVQLEDFYVTDDTTEARFFIPNQEHPLFAYDVINWIEMPQSITLLPGEGKDIYFKVRVPENTPTGGYYGALFFKTTKHTEGENPVEGEQSKVVINQRVGVLLVLAVKGTEPINKTGILQKFEALKKIFWESPVKLEASVINNGNIHYKAIGFVNIYKFGKEIDEIQIEQRMLYPGKYRKYETKWNFSPWAYGYYKAKFNLASEDMQIRVEGETNFWVIPWKTTMAIVIMLFIIWMIYKIFDSRFEIRKKGDDDEAPMNNEQRTGNNEQENNREIDEAVVQAEKRDNEKRKIV